MTTTTTVDPAWVAALDSDPTVRAVNRLRGHRFPPFTRDAAHIPPLYATDGVPLADKVVHVHYFTGGCDWYIFEVDPRTGEAFGWARTQPGCGEMGYIDLTELARIMPMAGTNGGIAGPVERDLHLAPGATFETLDVSP